MVREVLPDTNKLVITKQPDVALRALKSIPPAYSITKDIRQCAKDLIDTLQHHGYTKMVGLAANQIGHPLRMLGLRDLHGLYYVMINPQPVYGKEMQAGIEGCWSVGLDKYFAVMRYYECTVDYVNAESGRKETRTLNNLQARYFQHEYDHLDGITIAQKGVRA